MNLFSIVDNTMLTSFFYPGFVVDKSIGKVVSTTRDLIQDLLQKVDLLQEIRQRNVFRTVYFASCGPLHPKVS